MVNEVKTNIGVGCYNHPDRTVVANCPNCGKFMCRECAEKNKCKLCDSCEKERIERAEQEIKGQAKAIKQDSVGELIKVAVISIALAILGFCIGQGSGQEWMMAWIFMGFPWGWKIINQLMTGNFMTWLLIWTQKAWLVAYIIKFVLAAFIGMFAWPIKLIITIYHVVSAKNLEKKVAGGN